MNLGRLDGRSLTGGGEGRIGCLSKGKRHARPILDVQRNGVFYLEDKLNGKQKSLKTRDPAAARRMLAGKNQATEIPQMNLAMAKVYLSCKSEEMLARTWEDVMKDMEQGHLAFGAVLNLPASSKSEFSESRQSQHATEIPESDLQTNCPP